MDSVRTSSLTSSLTVMTHRLMPEVENAWPTP